MRVLARYPGGGSPADRNAGACAGARSPHGAASGPRARAVRVGSARRPPLASRAAGRGGRRTRSEDLMNGALTRDHIEQRVRELGDWFHNMNLGGVQTAPAHFLGDYPSVKWREFAHTIPQDLTGRSVLDIGCNGGVFFRGVER